MSDADIYGREHAIVVSYQPVGQPQRRLVFEPQTSGTPWRRIEQVRDGDGWRTTGAERVETVNVENADSAPDS